MYKLLFFLAVVVTLQATAQKIDVEASNVNLVAIDKYHDIKLYNSDEDLLYGIGIDYNEAENTLGVIQDEYPTAKEDELKDKVIIQVSEIKKKKQKWDDSQYEYLNGDTRKIFEIFNEFLVKVTVFKKVTNDSTIWELIDIDYYPYFFLTLAQEKQILIVQDVGFVIPKKNENVVCVFQEYFKKSNLKDKNQQGGVVEDFKLDVFYYIKNEIDNRQSLRLRFLDHLVTNKIYDSVYFDNQNIVVRDKFICKLYSNRVKAIGPNNIRAIFPYGNKNYQVLIGNKMGWLSEGGELIQKPDIGLLLCGTVNYYEYSILKDILRVKTTTPTLEPPIQEEFSIPNIDSTQISFINGETKLNFDENDLIGIYNVSRNLLLVKKDHTYGLKEFQITKEDFIVKQVLPVQYGSIEFTNYYHPIKIGKEGLYGYFPISNKVIFKSLGKFDGYFSRFELPDGRKGWIDLKGNEYIDK